MKRFQRWDGRFWRMVCSALLAAVFSAPARSADWPQFRGLHRDGHSPETGLLKQWPEDGLKPLWVATGLGRGYSSVTVASGRLYVTGMAPEGEEGFLYAFDLKGAPLWKKSYGPDWNGMYPGARACPTVEGNRLYMVSGVGKVFCFDAVSGNVLWSRDFVNEFGGQTPRCGFVESLYLDGDRVICTPGGKEAAFAALDKLTGKTLWTSRGFGDQSAYCAPIPVQRGGQFELVTITARHVVGFNPQTGEVFWRQPFDTEAEDPNHSTSPVYADGYVYATSGHGKGGRAYELSADGKGCEEKWADETLNTNHEGLLLVDGYVYGTSAKNHWVCIELKTGNVMFDTRILGRSSAIFADGMLYCYAENGTLAMVPASPRSFEPVSSFKIAEGDGQHWAHPVISDGCLYIRHGGALLAFAIKAK